MKFFALHEFECRCGCGLQDMDAATLEKFDQLRFRFGKPMTVTSGRRCKKHDLAVSTVTNGDGTGPHTTGKAADFAVDSRDAYELVGHAIAMGFTGIGVSQRGGKRFVHLDTLTGADGIAYMIRPNLWSY